MRKGFTLTELLVVIGIVAVLLAITIPSLAKARASARNVASAAGLREVTSMYLMYAQNHRGALLPGFLNDRINGVEPRVSDPVSGQTFAGRAARQWPFRLAEGVGGGNKSNLWPLLRPTLGWTNFPSPSDTAAQAESKAYTAGLYPVFGLNTIFLGGHGYSAQSATAIDYYQGFKPDGTPNIGRHVAYRLSEIRNTSRQIVFTEVAIQNGSTSVDVDDRAGLHYVNPPRADQASGQYWKVEAGRVVITLPDTPRRTLGVPYSRAFGARPNPRIPTAFLDGHVETPSLTDLTDMRLWAPRATSPDYSF